MRTCTLLLLPLTALVSIQARTLHVDCAGGDDSRDGLYPGTAVKTLAVANGQPFAPGDSILLLRGTKCGGPLSPRGSGTPQSPITIGVTVRPTTILIGTDGRIAGRWTGFAPAQNLGLAVQKLLGVWQFGDYYVPRRPAPGKRLIHRLPAH